jgi:serine phosphatase RsbU (regulator of sigma subunit)
VRAHFLAEAGGLLDSSLDYEETLTNVAQIAVPEIADWCAVSMLDDQGVLHDVAAKHADPEKLEIGRELRRRFLPSPEAVAPPARVTRSGRTLFVPDLTDEMLAGAAADERQLDLMRQLDLRSVVITPLRAGDRTIGALTLATSRTGREFDEGDRQFAEELARRASLAIENARLYTERLRIAHTLQAGLLPRRLPDIPGVAIAARYRAAGELNEVGGDFYDVFQRDDGSWAFLVGDVSGKGADAAAVTALARYTLRANGRRGGPPSHALARLNDEMVADGTTQFATVVLAHGTAGAAGQVELELALGGHPPPIVLRSNGDIELAGEFGSLLGIHDDPALADTGLSLEPGDSILLYTDGVIEAGPRSAPVDIEGLLDFVRPLTGRPPEEVVAAVERLAVDAQEGDPKDDIALLAVQVSDHAADAQEHA